MESLLDIGLQPWHIWAIIALCLFISEVFVPGFILARLGVGALVGGLAHQLTDDMGWGIGGFATGAGVSLALIRPYLARALSPRKSALFGADSMIGDVITVADAGDVGGKLKARYRDSLWSLRSSDDLFEGDRVVITAVDGATLIVQRAEEQ